MSEARFMRSPTWLANAALMEINASRAFGVEMFD
jgi:hypothetical protein